MREKLEILMADTGLRVGEIAAKLGVKAPVISHILAGRNQPNFNLTAKIVSTFNQYNPYWWLGTSDVKLAINNPIPQQVEQQTERVDTQELPFTSTEQFEEFATPQASGTVTASSSTIERIVVFYTDKSFECFTPRK